MTALSRWIHAAALFLSIPASALGGDPAAPFVRGDCNGDSRVDIADPIFIVRFLYLGGPESSCREACDANADNLTDLSDALYLINYQFLGGPPPPPPFPECGASAGAECESSPCLPCGIELQNPRFASVGWPNRASLISPAPGGTCSWDVSYSGDGRVEVEATGCEAVITGLTPSSAMDDVKVVAHYVAGDMECTAETTLTVIQIEAANIKFDHEGPDTGTGDALNIRRDADRDLDHMGNGMGLGEWVKDERNEPALYVAGNEVACQVRFRLRGPAIRAVTVQADAVDGRLFGGIEKQTIQFRDGISEPEFVTMKFDAKTPGQTRSDTGSFQWAVTEVDGRPSGSLSVDKSGPHKFYNVLAVPKAPWYEDETRNPWVIALDSEILLAVLGAFLETFNQVAVNVTNGVHFSFDLQYDTQSGLASYCNNAQGQITFDFSSFLERSNGNIINCFDTAAAVTTIAALFGADTEYIHFHDFGFISKTHLIGRDDCNNPFADEGTYLPDLCVTDPASPFCVSDKCHNDLRSGFGSHSMVRVTTLGFERVFDACVGPHLGTEEFPAYLSNSIDATASCEASFAGNMGDIVENNVLILE